MDAELYDKGVKMICSRQSPKCWTNPKTNTCVLFDRATDDCCATPDYHGDIDPTPIVEQWLADHPEPTPLPKLPEKLPIEGKDIWKYDKINILAGLMRNQNAIIDYLESRAEKGVKK